MEKKINTTIRPERSNWGEWGRNDKIGQLNLISDDVVVEAVKEIKIGKRFCLSLPLDLPGNNVLNMVRKEPRLKPIIREKAEYYNYRWDLKDERLTDIASDDSVLIDLQFSTQWDGLCHRGAMFDQGNGPEPLYYNGFKAKDTTCVSVDEALPIGIENMADTGVQGRAVLVDLKSEVGTDERVEVGYDLLMSILDKQKIEVKKGDILCLWTGLDELIIENNKVEGTDLKSKCAVLDGWDDKLLEWIASSGISAIASDNLAIEGVGKKIPQGYKGSALPLHEQCIFKLGMHLGELWYLAELANWLKNNGRNAFFLTAPPLKLRGAAGSPVTPVGTV